MTEDCGTIRGETSWLAVNSDALALTLAVGIGPLDMNPDRSLNQKIREAIEAGGDRVADLHLWRLGPGHLGAIGTVATAEARSCDYYRNRLAGFRSLSHLTVEITGYGPMKAA